MSARRSVLRARGGLAVSVAERTNRATALEALLIEKGVVTESEVKAKADAVRGRQRVARQELSKQPRSRY